MDAPLEQIKAWAAQGQRVLLAIDGRCGSGKTTLARALARRMPCSVIHMDDFFLPPALRTAERLAQPGWNVEVPRLIAEVLAPLQAGRDATFCPFDCGAGGYGPPVTVPYRPISVVEGSYSLHPALRGYYTHSLFLTCTAEEQARRLGLREPPQKLQLFLERWIPMEEAYLRAYSVADYSDFTLDTTYLSEEVLE